MKKWIAPEMEELELKNTAHRGGLDDRFEERTSGEEDDDSIQTPSLNPTPTPPSMCPPEPQKPRPERPWPERPRR